MWAARAARDNTEAYPREIQNSNSKKKNDVLVLAPSRACLPCAMPFSWTRIFGGCILTHGGGLHHFLVKPALGSATKNN